MNKCLKQIKLKTKRKNDYTVRREDKQNMELKEYINKWSEKLSLTEADIQKEYDVILTEEAKIHPALNEEDRKQRTLQRLAMTYKKQMRSPAVGFEGMIIAVGDSINTVARLRREAQTLFRNDPQTAVESGVTDSNGNPLDQRKEWKSGQPNRGYGKPLPEFNWLRTIYGIASKKNVDEPPRFFTMMMSGDRAIDKNIPIFYPVAFRAIDRTAPEDGASQYRLNSSTFTQFDIDETINLPKEMDLINQYCSGMKIELSALIDYHEGVKDDYNRLVIVEGDVTALILEPTSVGSRRMILDDSNIDLESPGTTCWIPEHITIDFAEQSKVIVIGRTARGKKLDEQGNQTEEPGDVMINVYGLYALPDYKISPDIEELVEEIKSPEPAPKDW